VCGLRIGLGLRLALVLRYIRRFAVYMVRFTYIDLVDTITATSPAHPCEADITRHMGSYGENSPKDEIPTTEQKSFVAILINMLLTGFRGCDALTTKENFENISAEHNFTQFQNKP